MASVFPKIIAVIRGISPSWFKSEKSPPYRYMMRNIVVSFAAAALCATVSPFSYILTFALYSSSNSMMSCLSNVTLSCNNDRPSHKLLRKFFSSKGIGVGMCFFKNCRSDSRGACTARIVNSPLSNSSTANSSS